MVLVFVLVFALIIGGIAFMVMKTLKKVSGEDTGVASDTASIDTAQKFLPFENIKNGILDLGAFKYRMIIECSSINYALKTDDEQEIIEMSFQRTINSFHFPFTMFIQTREIDNRIMLESLKADIELVKEKYPQMSDYADKYLEEMKNLTITLQNTKQKKKYIIIPFDEAATLTSMNKEEKFEYARTEIFSRTQMIKESLSSVGIKATILNTAGIVEMLYNCFHKDNATGVDGLLNGEFLTMMVEGVFENKNNNELLIGNRMAHMEPFEKMYLILSQAHSWVKGEIMPMLSDVDYIALADAALMKLDELRDSTENAYIEIAEEKAEIANKLEEKKRSIYGGDR